MTLLNIGSHPRRIVMSRRRMMQLGAALAATPLAACGSGGDTVVTVPGIASWPADMPFPDVTHPGYGTYPDYEAIGPTGPWPKILSDEHKRSLDIWSDLVLPATDTAPAPSAIGIAEFWDDWTSAPYPYMTDTRRLVHRGFAWIDAQMRIDFSTDWLSAQDWQRKKVMDRMRDAAAVEDEPVTSDAAPNDSAVGSVVNREREALRGPTEMYTHLRKLVIGAYYTTPEGEADLGHIPAEPMAGDYPGPTGEALDHILGIIAGLDLPTDDLPLGPPPYDLAPYSFTGDEPA